MSLLDTISITGLIVDAYGNPASGVECIFSVTCPPVCMSHIGIKLERVMVETDSTGGFEIDLIMDAVYRVTIDDVGLIGSFTTPSDGTSANLFELLNC